MTKENTGADVPAIATGPAESADSDVAFALDDFATLDTATMNIVPPNQHRPIGWIEFAGPGHPKALAVSDENTRKALYDLRQRQVLGTRYKGPREQSADELEIEIVKRIVDRIVAWSVKGRDEQGQVVDVPFTPALAMKWLRDPRKGWLFTDSNNFINGIENFMPASSPS